MYLGSNQQQLVLAEGVYEYDQRVINADASYQ